ncbi:hypothetical protein [Mesorhizobium sp. M0130]|uniref:hypothetical protein n=1 Tax=Mesorhizobium sp. M0130 TaxID=2956887 RepID=UPI00333A0D87
MLRKVAILDTAKLRCHRVDSSVCGHIPTKSPPCLPEKAFKAATWSSAATMAEICKVQISESE